MSWRVVQIPSVDGDIERAVNYYNSVGSSSLSVKFINRLIEAEEVLALNPYFEIKYKNVRTLLLKQFPFHLHFILVEESKTVVVIALAYAKELPRNYLKRVE